MINTFPEYLRIVNNDYEDFTIKLLNKFAVFSNDLEKHKKRLKISCIILKYLNTDYVFNTTDGLNVNIITTEEVLKLIDCLNIQLNKKYKIKDLR
jgi:hypothetical protein